MTYPAVKGTRDFYPEYMAARDELFQKLCDVANSYGFNAVESPALETLKLLTAKSGEEITQQIFVTEKRSSEEIGLRFDMTVPLARMFIAKQKELPKPVKWSYATNMWRYEAPQRGRLREFYQFGVELFGASTLTADAEIISLAIDCLQKLGLTEKDIVLKVNSRKLVEAFLKENNIDDTEKTLRAIDKRPKLSEDAFSAEISFLTDYQQKALLKFLDTPSLDALTLEDTTALAELQELWNILPKEKQPFIEFSPSITRGLAYYTGIVFEVFDRKGEFRAILGGGRYDDMIEQFGGQSCPATGFAMGDVVIELVLKSKGLWKEEPSKVDYFIAPVNEEFISKAVEIASYLRKKGKRVDIDLMNRKLGKQFSYATQINAQYVAIIGDETNEGNVAIKDLNTGKEETISINKLN